MKVTFTLVVIGLLVFGGKDRITDTTNYGNQRHNRDVLLKEKAKRQAAEKVEDAALKILAKQHKDPQKKLIGNEITECSCCTMALRGRNMAIQLVRPEQST